MTGFGLPVVQTNHLNHLSLESDFCPSHRQARVSVQVF